MESKTEICMLRRRIADLEKERQADKEKIKELEEEINDWKFTKNYVEDNYIHKNEIKAKIEELDIEIQCCEYADDDLEEYKQDMEKEKARLLRNKAILQSLLGKE